MSAKYPHDFPPGNAFCQQCNTRRDEPNPAACPGALLDRIAELEASEAKAVAGERARIVALVNAEADKCQLAGTARWQGAFRDLANRIASGPNPDLRGPKPDLAGPVAPATTVNAKPVWTHDGETWSTDCGDGTSLNVYESDAGWWQWGHGKMVAGEWVETCTGQRISRAMAQKSAVAHWATCPK